MLGLVREEQRTKRRNDSRDHGLEDGYRHAPKQSRGCPWRDGSRHFPIDQIEVIVADLTQ